MTFRGDDDAIGIDPQAHRSIGKGGWNTVAVAFQMNEAGWGAALPSLTKKSHPIEFNSDSALSYTAVINCKKN